MAAVSELLEFSQLRAVVREKFKTMPDIERLLSRLSVGLGNARDLVNLRNALLKGHDIKKEVCGCRSALLQNLEKDISQEILLASDLITNQIVDDAPIALKEGGIIKLGVHQELDRLRTIVSDSKNWISELEKSEREKTSIGSLKIRFNKVFGFYIEISKANLHLVPKDYTRKQTLVNGERFVTPELKKHEEIILSAAERVNELEYEVYREVLKRVLSYTRTIQNTADSIAVLDCLTCFAYLAQNNDYIRPLLVTSGEIHIKNGRHPVVEKLLDDSQFVPNDVILDSTHQQILLITGPNMAGKSVLIRQVALIVLMAHIGCFVPAEIAEISLVDRIFVRSGAADVIASGLSTFMVEMVETDYILNHATAQSLIIMDEIGRGTSTYDGISIAWAVAEFLATGFSSPPKTLFATHYHELQALEKHFPGCIKNYHLAVENKDGAPIFLHTLVAGGASYSFGLAVAKLAGVPQSVVDKAQAMLLTLGKERSPKNDIVRPEKIIDPVLVIEHLIAKELEKMDIAQMTPLEALNMLAELKEKLKISREVGELKSSYSASPATIQGE